MEAVVLSVSTGLLYAGSIELDYCFVVLADFVVLAASVASAASAEIVAHLAFAAAAVVVDAAAAVAEEIDHFAYP